LSTLGNRLHRAKTQAHRILEFVVGVLFMILAAACITVCMTQWHKYVENPATGLSLFYMFVVFSLVLFFCSLYSFLKARSIR
jgi:TRAP-type C4-dicarboxylate transport system permease small subunit